MSTEYETSELNNFVASFAQDAANKVYRNGYAVFLYTKGTSKKEGMKYAASVLDECFMQEDRSYVSNKKSIVGNLKSLESSLSGFKKRLKVNWNNNNIQNFLLQPFRVPVSRKKQPLPSTSSVDITSSEKNDECFFPQEAQQDGTQDCFLPQVSQQQVEAPLPLKKLRTDCKQSNIIRKRFVIRCRSLEDKVRRVKLNAKSLCRSPEMKVWTQSLKRKTMRVETLKREKMALKNKVRHLEQKLRISATKMEKVSILSRSKRILQKKVTKLQQEVFQLEATLKARTEDRREAFLKVDELIVLLKSL